MAALLGLWPVLAEAAALPAALRVQRPPAWQTGMRGQAACPPLLLSAHCCHSSAHLSPLPHPPQERGEVYIKGKGPMVTTWLHGFTAHPPRRASSTSPRRTTGDSSFSVATTGSATSWSVQLGTRELTSQLANDFARASSADSDFTSMASINGSGDVEAEDLDKALALAQRGGSPRPSSQGYWEVHEGGQAGSGGLHGRSKLGMSPSSSPRSSLAVAHGPGQAWKAGQAQEPAEGQQQQQQQEQQQTGHVKVGQAEEQRLVGPETGARRTSVELVGQSSKVPLLQEEGLEEGQANGSCAQLAPEQQKLLSAAGSEAWAAGRQ